MSLFDRWRERRDEKFLDRWNREHRWSVLGQFNAERHRGLVHTPEYVARMAAQQAAFNREQGYGETSASPFPIRLDPS